VDTFRPLFASLVDIHSSICTITYHLFFFYFIILFFLFFFFIFITSLPVVLDCKKSVHTFKMSLRRLKCHHLISLFCLILCTSLMTPDLSRANPVGDLMTAEASMSARKHPMLLNKALGFLLQRKRASCCECPNCGDGSSTGKDVELNGKTLPLFASRSNGSAE
jgi:hypothetical protein